MADSREAPAAVDPLLSARGLVKHFALKRTLLDAALGKPARSVKAVDGVSFDLWRGQTLGLVGEIGCGKSTLGRTLVGLWKPDAGELLYEGMDLIGLRDEARLLDRRKKIQMVFQDPYSSLNPRMKVGAALREVLDVHRLGAPAGRGERVLELIRSVGLLKTDSEKYPGELSGGQRQRVGIARALAVGPQLLIADEPVSALDVSIQAQILRLLLDLRESLHLTMIFISHDLRVIRRLSDVVAVMYLGQIVEQAPTRELYRAPLHPYTRGLLGAVPEMKAEKRRPTLRLAGDLPSAIDVPSGCRFHPCCPFKADRCAHEIPTLREIDPGRRVACHFAEEIEGADSPG